MYLVVGLGNPGPSYAGHRHNVGFMAVDAAAHACAAGVMREKFKGVFARATMGGSDVAFLKPLTYMNLSGESVRAAMTFFKVQLSEVLVIHDELDLPFGTIRLKVGGGAAGHNGLRSIMQHGGGAEFARLRVGIGRPRSGAPEGFVLSDFSASERAELPTLLERCTAMTQAFVRDGAQATMNAYHTDPAAAPRVRRTPSEG